MMYARVFMGKEIMEQEIPKIATDLKKFSTEIKGEKRSEILKNINKEVKTKLNALSAITGAQTVCDGVNTKVTDSKKGLLKKGGLKSLLRDEHYIHVKVGELQITDDLKGEKPVKEGVDLDNRQHRGLVAGFLTGLIDADDTVKNDADFLQLMDYIDALEKLESEFSKTMDTETTLTKKETRKLRKTLRKDINLDKKEGEFDPLLTEYRKGVAAQAEVDQNAANEIAGVSKKIQDVGLKESGYIIEGAVKKIDDNTFSSNIEKNDVVINDVKFDKDGKAITGEYSGTKNSIAQQYTVTVGTDGKLIATEKTTDAPIQGVDKPADDTYEEIPEGDEKKSIIKLLEGVTITDLKLYKSPKVGEIKFYKITGKADAAHFTIHLDKDKKLQSEDGEELTPAGTDPVENGGYTFTQGSNNEITVAKNEEKEEEVIPVDLSERTIEQVNENATPKQIKTRLGELIDKVGSVPGKYFPGRNARKDGTYKNNPDIAWIQKGLIEYAKINPEFTLRSDSTFVNGIRSSNNGDEYKYTNSSWTNNFDEAAFVSGEYDSAFAGSVASFQGLEVSKGKQDGLPGKNTLTALKSVLSPEEVDGGG